MGGVDKVIAGLIQNVNRCIDEERRESLIYNMRMTNLWCWKKMHDLGEVQRQTRGDAGGREMRVCDCTKRLKSRVCVET